MVNRVKKIESISEASRDKKLSNKCIYDFVCLLYAYDEIVTSPAAKQKRYDEGQKKKFEEAYLNFKQEMYSSCLTVLTTVLEGVIVVI